MRVFALLLLLCSIGFAQVPSIPFTLGGNGMQIQGTFTAGPNGVCCAGVASLNGSVGVMPPCKAKSGDPGVYEWRFVVEIDDVFYVILIEVDTGALLGRQLTGWWYETGVPGDMNPLS